jgi:hypothetical protein
MTLPLSGNRLGLFQQVRSEQKSLEPNAERLQQMAPDQSLRVCESSATALLRTPKEYASIAYRTINRSTASCFK